MSTRAVIVCGTAIAAIGLIANLPYIVMSGAYLILGALLSRRYVKQAPKHLIYRRQLSTQEAFVGDNVTLKIRIENRKPLPVFWLKCEDEVPDSRTFGSLPSTNHYTQSKATLHNTVHLKWFEGVEREFEISCNRRGIFRLGPVTVEVGDPLGLETYRTVLHQTDTLTVYPEIMSLQGIPWLDRFPFGALPKAGWLHPDPLTIMGTRLYDGTNPMNQIAWKATAKTGTLQVKVLEPTHQARMFVALNLSTSQYLWKGIDSTVLEDAISIAASACYAMLNQNVSFGLISNSVSSGQGSLFIAPGLSASHLKRILDALAQITLPWRPFSQTLEQLRCQISKDTGVLAIMPYISDHDRNHLLALANMGCPVAIILVNQPPVTEDTYLKLARYIPIYRRCDIRDSEKDKVMAFERIG